MWTSGWRKRPPRRAGRVSGFDLARVRPVRRRFFNRDPVAVARALLGKVIVRKLGRSVMAGRIVEDEAYLGAGDAAAHSAGGRTARNAVIFGPPGHAYVYFIYGNHYCLNFTCLPEGDAGCVLIRALEPLLGFAVMARNRGLEKAGESPAPTALRALTSGPGRLCQALGITRARDNGCDVTAPDSGLWVGDDGYRPAHIAATPRIGITKAAAAELRYVMAGNAFVSAQRR